MPPFSFKRALQGAGYAPLCALMLLVALLDYAVLGFGQIIDQRGGDLLIQPHAAARPASGEVVVIDIDQRSLEEMNAVAGSWPWPRSVHGELVEYLQRQSPRAIVFDIQFSEVDTFRAESDRYFSSVLATQRNVYLAQTLERGAPRGWPAERVPRSLGVAPTPAAQPGAVLPLLAPNAVLNDLPPTQWGVIRGGIINFNQDSDQVGRHYWLYLTHAGWRIDSLPARVASDLGWPLPDQPEIRLNWRQTPPHFSYADLYFDSQREHPKLAPDLLRNKVIVIGARAPGLQDLRPTPLSAVYPGSDILATALDNLRAGDWLRERPRSAMLPLAMGLVVLLAWAFARGVSVARVGYALAAGSLACMAFGFWQLRQGTWWPVFSPLVYGWGAYWLYALRAYLHERAERERTVRLFQRFLDPRVVRGLVETGEIDMAARPQSREITVLFSDIRGFTTLSETRAPEYIVDLLNRYFTDQVAIVRKHGGTLDKFIGDAIMAFWGAPVSDPDHARHAVAAAIEMAEALERFKAELGDIGHDFDIGIGLNSGPAVVGFIGSEDRLDYTAIGDTVNLASRIEGQTKGVARVLIADATRRLAGEDFTYRDCGDHHVKGREQAVRLFEPARRKTTHETPHGEENKP